MNLLKTLAAITLCAASLHSQAALYTFTQTLDSNGKPFDSGEYISMNLHGQEVREVHLDVKGEPGSTATIYINGQEGETKFLNTYRETRVWHLCSNSSFCQFSHVNEVRIQFGDIDPRVYSTTVIYEAETEMQIEYRTVFVEVPQKQVFSHSHSLQSMFDQLAEDLNRNRISRYNDFVDLGIEVTEELTYYSDKSTDSDASQHTGSNLERVITTLDCELSQKILREISKHDNFYRDLVRRIRTRLTVLREMSDRFNSEQCSPELLALYPKPR